MRESIVRVSIMLPLLVAACSPEEDPPGDLSCKPASAKEIYDPYRHDVCLTNCSDAFDCPRGSICSRADEERSGYCAMPGLELQTSRRALLHGFAVDEMSAKLITEDAYELHWERPEEATIVNCVLLSCPPAFRIRFEGEWKAPDYPQRVEIANFHNCAIASEISTRPEGSFNLRERDNQHVPVDVEAAPSVEPTEEVRSCPPTAHGCAPVTELVAGCWAYDDSKILAATPLFTIDPREIYDYHQVFALDGECKSSSSDLFRACMFESSVEPEDDGTGTGTGGTGGETETDGAMSSQDESTTNYGLCSCATPPCTDDDELTCMRSCLSDCDCKDGAQASTCNRPSTLRGVCVGQSCTAIFGE